MMIYAAEDDDVASDASSLVSFDEEAFNAHPNALISTISRVASASSTPAITTIASPSLTMPPWQNLTPARGGVSSEPSSVFLSSSASLPTTPTSVSQNISEREAAFLARVCRPDEFSCQAIAFSRQLLLPHLSSYPVHRRISLLSDITCGCKDFSRLEHELPFAILETVNDAFDLTTVAALSPSLNLLSTALRYNTKAFALSGAFPLLGLTLAKLFLVFKDAKVFEQLVEISDIVVKRWILADMKEGLMPFLQSFIAASGRFWPSQPPTSAQQLIRTLINGCHSVVAVQALFDCGRGEVAVGDDPTVAVLGSLSTIRHLLMEFTASQSAPAAPSARSASPYPETGSHSSDTVSYTRKLIAESALPLVSNLITNNRDFCRIPKIFVEVTELLSVLINLQVLIQQQQKNDDLDNDWCIVILHCIETLDLAIHELSPTAISSSIGSSSALVRPSGNSLPAIGNTEPTVKYNALLVTLMNLLDEESLYFAGLYSLLSNSHSSPSVRSLEVVTRLSNYFCDCYLAKMADSSLVFIEIKNFLVTFYVRDSRQSIRECILSGLSSAFIAHPELISEMVVSIVIETVFAGSASSKLRSLISDTSSSKSAQAALSFIKQLFHATRPARNRHFFITQAMAVLFTASNGGSCTLIETLSRDIFGIIVANMTDSLTCTGPVLMKAVETFSSELSRRFESATSTAEMLSCWRPTLLRFLCLCSALDTNSLGHVVADRRFVEAACMFAKLDDLIELLNTSNLLISTERRDMVLIPGLKWSAELSVPVVSLKLLALALKSEKDPDAFKCFATITARFFAKRRILQYYASPALFNLVNELVELLCKCAATSIKRSLAEQQQIAVQQQIQQQQQQQLQHSQQQTQPQQPHQSQTQLAVHSSTGSTSLMSSPQAPSTHQAVTQQLQPSPYCLTTIFRTFLLVPALDFALEENRRCQFFGLLLKALKITVVGDAMDCLTLCLMHMSTKLAQDLLEQVTVTLSQLVSSTNFASNAILLMDTLRSRVRCGAITITQNSYLAIFSLLVSFTHPSRFGYMYASMAFNSMFSWFLDSPVHLRADLGSYLLKQLSGYRTFSDNSSSGGRFFDEMIELTRDVVTEHNFYRFSDFEPSRLTEFQSAPTWFLDNDRIVTFQKSGENSVSVLVRSPSSVSIFSLQRSNRMRKLQTADSDFFDNEVTSLVATLFGSSAALSLRKPSTQEAERGLKTLDLTLPFQKFKIGVLFCGPGQFTEDAILSNCGGTPRYESFIAQLGQVTKLVAPSDGSPSSPFLFTGGLETNGKDGLFTITYADEYCQAAFHVATLMPNHSEDPKRQFKKRHVGNDYVIVIYNASGSTPQQRGSLASVILSSFAYATIVVTPLLDGNNLIQLFGKNDVPPRLRWTPSKAFTVPEKMLADFVRTLAMHAEIAAESVTTSKQPDMPVFNWLERLRHIRRLRAKLSQMTGAAGDSTTSEVVYQ